MVLHQDDLARHRGLYRSLENFFAAHLGGRRSPVDMIELWLGLE
jgi:hypothetical protein